VLIGFVNVSIACIASLVFHSNLASIIRSNQQHFSSVRRKSVMYLICYSSTFLITAEGIEGFMLVAQPINAGTSPNKSSLPLTTSNARVPMSSISLVASHPAPTICITNPTYVRTFDNLLPTAFHGRPLLITAIVATSSLSQKQHRGH